MKKLGFGLMRLPLINDEFSRVDKKMLCDMVDYYLDKGFQYLIQHGFITMDSRKYL